jgi:hypothetical protein
VWVTKVLVLACAAHLQAGKLAGWKHRACDTLVLAGILLVMPFHLYEICGMQLTRDMSSLLPL